MKLRYGLVFASALSLAFGGCAASGGGSTSSAPAAMPSGGGEVLAQGENPRRTANTRAAQSALDEARSAEEDGSTEAAQAAYQAALEAAQMEIAADATNPLGYRLAAEASLGLGQYRDAGAMFDEAERLRPVYVLETERLRELAWIDRYQVGAPLVNSGDYEGAIEVFEQANAVYQGRPEVMITLGQLYAQIGEHDKAVETMTMARDIIESDKINDMDEETAANWREQGAMLPTMIAQSLVNAERFDEAVVALNELLAAEPDNISYLRTLGTTFVRMEQPDSAMAVYDRLLSMPGVSSSEYYAVGVGLYQMEAFVEAAEAFKGGAEASVNDRDNIEMWARSLQTAYPTGEDAPEAPAGAVEELLAAGQRWLELDPYNRNAYLIVAQTANRLGNQDLAREMVSGIEGLAVVVDNLQLQRAAGGGGQVVGAVRNLSADAGTSVTMEVTFYAADGSVMATESATVQLGQQEASATFRVPYNGDDYVGGYGYRLIM